ncbi:MAG: hypothetical protein RBR21_12675 [Bacteroidales bacterium]|nr:hypothetical protein [Bacteroidales bacterium]
MEHFIPGFPSLNLQHLIFDFNGTLACNGTLIEGVEKQLNRLSEKYAIHIVTADTFGTVKEQIQNICCEIIIIPEDKQDQTKLDYMKSIPGATCACIGNGRNDALMLRHAALGIAVIGCEGASSKTLMAADIVVNTITDALDLFIYPNRLKATLRK